MADLDDDEKRAILDGAVSRALFHLEFDVYLDYLAFMEEFLGTEHSKEQLVINSHLEKLGEDPNNLAWLQASGIFPGKVTEFAGLMRDSFFVSLYSYFENKLIRECQLRKPDHILLDFNDIRGLDVIERVKKYFTKVLRAKFPSDTPEWETIQNYRIIRNCIVHARGRLDEMKDKRDRDQLQRFVSKQQNISLSFSNDDMLSFFKSEGDIYLYRGFCEEACKTIRDFLINLLFTENKNGI